MPPTRCSTRSSRCCPDAKTPRPPCAASSRCSSSAIANVRHDHDGWPTLAQLTMRERESIDGTLAGALGALELLPGTLETQTAPPVPKLPAPSAAEGPRASGRRRVMSLATTGDGARPWPRRRVGHELARPPPVHEALAGRSRAPAESALLGGALGEAALRPARDAPSAGEESQATLQRELLSRVPFDGPHQAGILTQSPGAVDVRRARLDRPQPAVARTGAANALRPSARAHTRRNRGSSKRSTIRRRTRASSGRSTRPTS